jgi:hypothetical protein
MSLHTLTANRQLKSGRLLPARKFRLAQTQLHGHGHAHRLLFLPCSTSAHFTVPAYRHLCSLGMAIRPLICFRVHPQAGPCNPIARWAALPTSMTSARYGVRYLYLTMLIKVSLIPQLPVKSGPARRASISSFVHAISLIGTPKVKAMTIRMDSRGSA